MDQALTRRYRALATLALLAAFIAASSAALAQADPTRPPADLYAVPAPQGTVRTVAVTPGVPRVQSILVSLRPGGRRIAVIDGKMVRPGDRIGNAVVAAIHSTEVILKRGSTTQVLKLFRPSPRSNIVQP